MRCRSCKTANPAGNRFCEQCGTSLQLACSRCGHDVSPSARFCGNCGHGLTGEPAASEPARPKWGELKQATVLFADVVGSTELIAGLDPEEAMGRLRPAVLRMRHSVERFGGTVVRTLGDGIMALFGVPHALEGHALLACQAALHMQNTFGQGADGLAIRVGLHSGEVASDPQDAEDGHGGGAHGLTIHIASRVVAVAEPGRVCLTEACRNAAGAGCDTAAMGLHALKGIRDPVVIHQLLAVRSQMPERSSGASPATSVFRGRDAELAQLAQALQASREGNARVIGLTAEPGAGKSRLCQEFTTSCRAQGVPVYEVRAQLYGHALPLQPVLELFRHHFFGIAAGDDDAVARSRIAARFGPMRPSAEDLDVLNEFFGVAAASSTSTTLGPRARQTRLLTLVRELLHVEAHVHRVILIEDLHWLDEGSEEFVSLMVEAAAGTRTLLLLNYRPSYRCPWTQLPHFSQIELRELPAADMETLVRELLADTEASPEIVQLICRRAGGNPFFAEELARSLIESKLLVPGQGLPKGGLAAVERALPPTVQAVVGARLDRVGEPEKTLLQMCAIIGKDIPLAVLEHVASPLASQIERGLEGLCRAGLILPQPTDGGRRFAFRHPLIQEVAYGAQLKVRRGQVHATVAQAMELYYGEQLDEYAGLIAYHYEAAGQHLPAAKHMARAALWTASTSSARGIQAWRKVRSLLEQCARSPEVDRLRAFAGGKIVYLGWREGLERAEVERLLDEAIGLASDVDARLVQLLLFARGRLIQSSGGPADSYVESLERALALPGGTSDRGRTATLKLALSHAYTWAGRLDDALQASDEALAWLHEIDHFDREFIGFSVEQWAWGIRARVLNKLGRLAEAQRCLAELQLHVSAASDPVMRQLAHYSYLDHAWSANDVELARHHADRVAYIADEESSPYSRVLAASGRALALHVASDFEAARKQYTQALHHVREGKAGMDFEPEILAALAECELELGQYDAAAVAAGEAVRAARQRTNRFTECRALIVLACAMVGKGVEQRDAAADLLRQAERLLASTGARVLEPLLERARAACQGDAALGSRASAAVGQ